MAALMTGVLLEPKKNCDRRLKFSFDLPIGMPGKLHICLNDTRFRQGGPMGSIASVLSAARLTAQAVNELVVDVGFSTTVAGKTYVADVTYSSGEYIAEDANLSGAVATGNSVASAENNLTARIDVLV
jgi:hypothetical protein